MAMPKYRQSYIALFSQHSYSNHMYTRQQASALRQSFWTAFGKYMSPVPGAEGDKINWINYKTGIRHIYFRMEATSKQAKISIEITHPEPYTRAQVYEQFLGLQGLLHEELGENWSWQSAAFDEHEKEVAIISCEINGVNVFVQEQWPEIISFLKPRIIALDRFWSVVKPMFD